jgi:chemotaxis response regulator CheB
MFQHGLESLLSTQDEVEILGCASNLDMALEQIKKLKPDVVILDSTRVSGDGLLNFRRTLHQNMIIIGLNLYNNQLTLYQRNQRAAEEYQELGWRVDEVTDLLRAISHTPAAA